MIAYWQPGLEWMGDRLVGHWCPSFTGPTSFHAQDLSGFSYHGTLTNMDRNTAWQASGGNIALDFSSTTHAVNHSSISLARVHTTSVWVSARIANQFSFNALNGDGTGGNLCSLSFNTVTSGVDQLAYSFGGASVSVSISSILNLWSHCVSVRNNNTVEFFLNGVSVGSGTGAINADFNVNRFGQRNNNGVGCNALIDDYRLYTRILTPSEIMRLYEKGRGGGVLQTPYRRRSYRVGGFKAYWHRRQSQIIGGGLR